MRLVRTEEDFFTPDGKRQLRTHEEAADCHINTCAIHSPSFNIQNDEGWPYLWRTDRGILERVCKHGVGHPDIDSAAYLARIGKDYENVHGCCGCCLRTEKEES